MSFRDRLRGVPTVDAREALRLVAAGALVLDVRGEREWARHHVPGAAHIPLRDLEVRALELPDDRLIVTFCTAGLLSRGAARLLTQLGFDTVDLAGGLIAWRSAGGPLEADRTG